MISIQALRRALSAERLQAYAAQGDTDERDSACRYVWNLALCAAVQPSLHFLEVTLRNHVFDISRLIVDESKLQFDAVPCWLDAKPSLLEAKEREVIEDAKTLLKEQGKPLTPGRLVSKLNFGFWVSLCKRPYEQGRASGPALWPSLATRGFPFMKKGNRTRSTVFHRLNNLRELRNRVSHHEPIWDRNLAAAEQQILDSVGWMNHNLAEALRAESQLRDTIAAGHETFRPLIDRTVKQAPDDSPASSSTLTLPQIDRQ